MAQTQSTVNAILSNRRTENSVDSNTVHTLTGSECSLDQVLIDNSLNSSTSYLRIWDTTGTVVNGTTDPDFVLPAAAGKTVDYTFAAVGTYATLASKGAHLTTGLKYSVVTTGGTVGSSAPSSAVTVKFLTSE
jgi:hypothetical protein|tara:strand:+ start:262 stop:660 length:399 start_codon:yes stop_codon:yes gene_type:complete